MKLSFSEQYRTVLKRANKTAAEVADIIGVSRQNLSTMLSKDDLRVSQMQTLCDAIGADLSIEINYKESAPAPLPSVKPHPDTPKTNKPAPRPVAVPSKQETSTPIKQDPANEVLNPSAPPEKQYTRAMVERWKVNKPNWDTPEEEQLRYDQYMFDSMSTYEEG